MQRRILRPYLVSPDGDTAGKISVPTGSRLVRVFVDSPHLVVLVEHAFGQSLMIERRIIGAAMEAAFEIPLGKRLGAELGDVILPTSRGPMQVFFFEEIDAAPASSLLDAKP